MFLNRFIKQRTAKQFHYMPRYGDDKKFNLIYRSIGRMEYAESYANKKFDKKASFLKQEDDLDTKTFQTEKRVQFKRNTRLTYNSSKMILLILASLIILTLALFGFDLTVFITL